MKKTKEIRWILMGRTFMENGTIRKAVKSDYIIPFSGNGSGNALFFGVSQRRRRYEIPKGRNGAKDGADALSNVGRKLELKEDPPKAACLRRNTMANQRLYTADITEDGLLELSVFSGRSLLAPLTLFLALRRLERFLPEGYVLTKEEKLSKEERKKQKQEKKQEKRQRRSERRRQGKTLFKAKKQASAAEGKTDAQKAEGKK